MQKFNYKGVGAVTTAEQGRALAVARERSHDATHAKLIVAAALARRHLSRLASANARSTRQRARRSYRRRPSRSIRCGPSRCRITGCSATSSASAWTRTITCSSSIATTRSTRRKEIGAAQNPPLSECCVPAPPVLEFDPAGNLVKAWGGPPADKQYVWPSSNHGISIDNKNNVWIGGNGGGNAEPGSRFAYSQVHARRQIPDADRRPGTADEQQRHHALRPRREDLVRHPRRTRRSSPTATANHRVAVLDMNNGRIKRFWGAYGNVPSDSNLRPLQSRRRRSAAVPNSGALRGAEPAMVWSTCATVRTTAFRSSRRAASS